MSKRAKKHPKKLPNNEQSVIEFMVDRAMQQYADPKTVPPNWSIVTDPRMQMFAGKSIMTDIKETFPQEQKAQALQHQHKFVIAPEPDQSLLPSSLLIKITSRIVMVNANGDKAVIPPPQKLRQIVSVDRDVDEEVEDPTTKQKFIKNVKKTVLEEREYIDGIGVSASAIFPLTVWRAVYATVGTNQMSVLESSHELFHYQCYIKSLFEFSKGALDNQLKAALAIYDTEESVSPFTGNTGLSTRYLRSGAKKQFTTICPLMIEGLTNIDGDLLLPPGCPVVLDFVRNPPQICLTSNKPEQRVDIEILDMTVRALFVTMTDEARKGLGMVLVRKPACCNYVQNEMEVHSIPKETLTYRHSLPRDKPLPERMALFFVPTASFRGSLGTNGFWLWNEGLKSYQLDWGNGRKTELVEADFQAGEAGVMYMHLLDQLNKNLTNQHLDNLTLKEFMKGKFVIVLDLSRHRNAASVVDSHPRFAPLDIILTFSSATTMDLFMLTMSQTSKTYVVSSENKASYV